MQDKEYLRAAATAIARQLEANPVILSIPIDPDVADYMGAFVEDGLLTVTDSGEVIYGGN